MKTITLSLSDVPSDVWDHFISSQGGCILQSTLWARFQKRFSKELLFVALMKEDSGEFTGGNCLAASLVLINPLPLGFSYLFFPRGPVFARGVSEDMRVQYVAGLAQEAARQFKNKKIAFVRVEPEMEWNSESRSLFKAFKFKKTISQNPQTTTMIDITGGEEEMLARCKQKTRYNIRLAEKKGVTVVSSAEVPFETFWRLMTATSNQQRFRLHPKGYYRVLLDIARETAHHKTRLEFFYALHDGDYLACAIVAVFGQNAYYLHGGSAKEKSNLMAPHLLHWEIIKKMKQEGITAYDLWGANPSVHKKGVEYKESLVGVTRFKEGFGGRERSFVGTYDMPIKPLHYKGYMLARSIRRGIS
jgi:lipid II:glycine glycyltransferase (peptidoglycan interpeptide bridge formation enzyme)